MVRETSTIVKGQEVYDKLLSGSAKMKEAVVTTLGPYGRNVALTKIWNNPHITKDGVTVAKGINLEDPIENIAAQVIKEAADKTAKEAGDGTTSTTILTDYIFKETLEKLNSEDIKYSDIKKQVEDTSKVIIKKIKELSEEVGDNLKRVALVSSNNDEYLSELVAEAFTKIGKNGIVTVTESNTNETKIVTTDGIRLDRTHINTSMVEKPKEVYANAMILVTNLNLSTDIDAFSILALQEEIKKPLLVICNDIERAASEILTYNKKVRNVPIIVIRAPYISDARRDACQDIAIATGGEYIDKDLGWEIKSVNANLLGKCDYVEIDLKETNIIGRYGDDKLIEERLAYYDDKISKEPGLKSNYEQRKNILNGGAAVIYVGGTNEIEVTEKKDRLDDTIRAVKAALEQGVVPGGGVTYLKIRQELSQESLTIGGNIMLNALPVVTGNIIANQVGSTTDEEVILKATKEFIDSVKDNYILDPTLVLTNAIENAVGAALMLAGTSCVIVKKEE